MSTEEYIHSVERELDRLKALGCPVGMGSHVPATQQPHDEHANADEDDPDEDEEFADLDVIVACVRAIDTLDEITQDRVVRWLHAHYVDQAR